MEMFANLCTNISAARKDQIISILADYAEEKTMPKFFFVA